MLEDSSVRDTVKIENGVAILDVRGSLLKDSNVIKRTMGKQFFNLDDIVGFKKDDPDHGIVLFKDSGLMIGNDAYCILRAVYQKAAEETPDCIPDFSDGSPIMKKAMQVRRDKVDIDDMIEMLSIDPFKKIGCVVGSVNHSDLKVWLEELRDNRKQLLVL